MKSLQFNRAFTLIELLVVIAIVGILSGFIIVSMSSSINAAKDAKIKSDIGTITKALLVYAANNNSYPSGDTYPCTIGGGTTRCTTLESALAPYLTAIPKTPNNGFYTYSYSGTGPSFTLQSTLSSGSTYQYNSASYFSTISYTSTCEAATNAQVQCVKSDINSTEEVCKCTYLSGAGQTTWNVPVGVTSVRALVVGGGGGATGNIYSGGGGGAGGLIYCSNCSVQFGNNINITVGNGGSGCTWSGCGAGGDSFFGAMKAFGGGPSSASSNTSERNGGSGGGNNQTNPGYGGGASIQTSNNGGTGYGNAGGASIYRNPDYPTGSGGGAGGAGSTMGSGGIGMAFDITGDSVYYAGGGGCTNAPSSGAVGTAGGLGGGGGGVIGGVGISGTNGYGGGGGGSRGVTVSYGGGNGGSGVVIFRYTHP